MKLSLSQRLGPQYNQAVLQAIVGAVENKVNALAEGRLAGRHFNASVVPTTGDFARGDIIWESSPSVAGSIAAGVAADWVRLGWICTDSGSPGTLKEMRIPVGSGSGTSVPAGTILDYAGSSAPGGYLACDGTAVSRATYAGLFTAIGTSWGAGDGSTTFSVPDLRGRARLGSGTGTATASGSNADVDTTNDTLTVASNNTKWITGMAVVFTLASGTITGLTSGNTYYVIRSSSTLVKLASSLANAQAGTAIDFTAKSSPVWTITYTLTARTLAEQGGEEGHAQSSSELFAHTHAGTDSWATSATTGGAQFGGSGAADKVGASNFNSGSRGGNAAANIIQPFAVVMSIIKT